MNKEEKYDLVLALTEQMKEYGNFYITDTSNLTVAKINDIRRQCFQSEITMKVAKNSLIKKAMEAAGGDYTPIFDVLKGSSSILFSKSATAPAKLIKQLRKKSDKPILKAAYIDSAIFIGDNQIDTLIKLKSKEQLIGEVIGLLQSPAKNVISALQSGGNTIAGLVKTLQERG
ncbi:50S ribosomal protein L10 [Mucilaginibacter sp. AW1-7]|jgi:large subunit ribosomal protein L10|uniref:Large ribosomal subunit protein uL10 n=1 Tax=Mucilaginibacter ginsenosidivorax TaxID=862126 RepID=A0A5B8W506_9SPHI|nr:MULTISPECIES: 50S ribosomal protein L10 [Mucilaginibacter]QEC78065.1 50S ribosomal protein L10 [Mucilaginibacter ginsenosidivorax]WDF79135.1 50S ribosomal protein L10 [Mucilaginibacter sp. KACC 22773]SEO45644.1 LSU ribosomal protein L10P [Mucilaginibacter sp. OK283]